MTTRTKPHTPGPWTLERIPHPDLGYTFDILAPDHTLRSGQRCIANVLGNDDDYEPVDMANAHLIAASPLLLAACEAALPAFARMATEHDCGQYARVEQLCRAAIRAARNEET